MTLHYKQIGMGPNIILIHGLFGSLDNLNIIARNLADKFTVTAIDLRNHGFSTHNESMTYDDMMYDIVTLMDDLKISHAHFIGHSMGGKVAMQVALNHADKVKKLVILDIAPIKYQPSHDNVFKGLYKVQNSQITNRKDADTLLSEDIKEAGVRQFLLKSFINNNKENKWRFNIKAIHKNYESILHSPEGTPFTAPCLFIKGNNSLYITEAMRDEILSLFPNSTAKIIFGAGHWLHAEKPIAVNKSIYEFLLS